VSVVLTVERSYLSAKIWPPGSIGQPAAVRVATSEVEMLVEVAEILVKENQ